MITIVVDLLDFNFNVCLDIDFVATAAAAAVRQASLSSSVYPFLDFYPGCVFDSHAFVALISLARPECAFPSAESLYFRLGQAQAVEGFKEASVVGKAPQTLAVRCKGVV